MAKNILHTEDALSTLKLTLWIYEQQCLTEIKYEGTHLYSWTNTHNPVMSQLPTDSFANEQKLLNCLDKSCNFVPHSLTLKKSWYCYSVWTASIWELVELQKEYVCCVIIIIIVCSSQVSSAFAANTCNHGKWSFKWLQAAVLIIPEILSKYILGAKSLILCPLESL